MNLNYDSDSDDKVDRTGINTTDLDLSVSLEQAEAAALAVDPGFDVQEALDASFEYNYLHRSSTSTEEDALMQEQYASESIFLSHISPTHIQNLLDQHSREIAMSLTPSQATSVSTSLHPNPYMSRNVVPHVYLSSRSDLNNEIIKVIHEFSLNEEQAFAFSIVARQSCRQPERKA